MSNTKAGLRASWNHTLGPKQEVWTPIVACLMTAAIVCGKPFAAAYVYWIHLPMHVTPALQHQVLSVKTSTQPAVNAAVQRQQHLDSVTKLS